jgi:hypothetical protein
MKKESKAQATEQSSTMTTVIVPKRSAPPPPSKLNIAPNRRPPPPPKVKLVPKIEEPTEQSGASYGEDDTLSYTSSVIPEVESLTIEDDESVMKKPVVTGLHEALIRLYFLTHTRGKGRTTKEWRACLESIIMGYEHEREEEYYSYIRNPPEMNSKGEEIPGKMYMRKNLGTIVSEFCNSAWGFKLDVKLRELLLERVCLYCKTVAFSNKDLCVDIMKDIKNFLEDCFECCQTYKKKIVTLAQMDELELL